MRLLLGVILAFSMFSPSLTVVPSFTCRSRINIGEEAYPGGMCLAASALTLSKYLILFSSVIVPLVFVHVFKCAGSSIRKVMRVYGNICGMSVATLTECGVSDKDTRIRIAKGQMPCTLKDFYLPTRLEFSYAAEEEKEIQGPHVKFMKDFNIVQGHVRVGLFGLKPPITMIDTTVDNGLASEGGPFAYYVTWMRNPILMFLSGTNFVMGKRAEYKAVGEEEQYKMLFQYMQGRLSKNKHVVGQDRMYSLFAAYYLPFAGREMGSNSSTEVKAKIKENLKSFQIIGILENHEASMGLLRWLLDPYDDIESSFWKSASYVETNIGHEKGNVKVSTKGILKRVKRRPLLWYNILLFLKDEIEIFEYAVQLHVRQCETFQLASPMLFNASLSRFYDSGHEACRGFLRSREKMLNFEEITDKAKIEADKFLATKKQGQGWKVQK